MGKAVADCVQIQNLSEMHRAMIDWMIAHPAATRSEMAAHFGRSRPWLSTIIHSDAFQAELRRRQEQVYNVAIIRPLQERLLGAANFALDRLFECLEAGVDPSDISGTLEMLLKATGNFKSAHGGGTPAIQQNNQFNYNVGPEDIARARQLVGRSPLTLAEPAYAETGQLERKDAPGLPALGDDRGGTDSASPSVLTREEAAQLGL